MTSWLILMAVGLVVAVLGGAVILSLVGLFLWVKSSWQACPKRGGRAPGDREAL